MSNFWAKYTTTRSTRRRFIKAGGALSASALLLLAGCGGDDDDKAASGGTGGSSTAGGGSGAASGSSGLLATPVDSEARAKKGGEWHSAVPADVQSFDAATGTATDVGHANRSYSRLLKHKVFKWPDPIKKEVVADGAESWEVSPDGMTYTYKIRSGLKYDPRPTTNGRPFSAKDAKFSVDRFLKSSRNRGDLSNAVNPNSPIVSASAPDDSTFQVKLAFPYAPFNFVMSDWRYIVLMPVEAESGFDVRQTMRGTGAWRLTEDTRGVQTVYERNSDWYDASNVFLDKMIFHVIPEAATANSQLASGGIWTNPSISQEDLLQLKTDHPELVLMDQELFDQGDQWLRFGYKPGSVFLDDRVRQAVSMLLDRQIYIDTIGNVEKFKAAGLDVPSRWNSSFICGYEEWIDPKDEKAFGENSKWFKFDPSEAKKLLSAAGHNEALELPFSYPVNHYGPEFDRTTEILRGMIEEGGNFKLTPNTMEYSGVFSEKYTNGDGQWDGIATANTSGRPDIDPFLFEWFVSDSQRSDFTLADGSVDSSLEALITKQRAENDPAARAAVLKQIQQYLAGKMYKIWAPGQALGFTLAQPWIGNWGVYRQPQNGAPEQEGWIHHWDSRLA